MKNRVFSSLFIVGAVVNFAACSKDDNNTTPGVPSYEVPTTYTFENVDFKEATARVRMLSAINSYMSTTQSNASQVTLEQTKVNNMWTNSSQPFDTTWLNTSGVNLQEKTADATLYKSYLDSLVTLSAATLTPAANGQAGYITRNAGKILISKNGLEYVQAVQKGTMGAALFKEAMALLDQVPNSDNNTVIAGKGTAMAHNFDLAFGYFSVPVNYDTSKAFADANRPSLVFWGNYIRERGLFINAHDVLWKAFRTGRAAIAAKDTKVIGEQVAIIKEYWEKVAAAAAWAYLSSPQSAAGNLASQFHALSEGFGFLASLKYRPSSSKLSAADYQKLVDIVGAGTNFYDLIGDANFTRLKEAVAILKNAYGQLQAE